MNTAQNYATSNSDTTPYSSSDQFILTEQIRHLQNVCLLAAQINPGNYALHRSIESLGIEISVLIHRLDPAILEAISHPSTNT